MLTKNCIKPFSIKAILKTVYIYILFNEEPKLTIVKNQIKEVKLYED